MFLIRDRAIFNMNMYKKKNKVSDIYIYFPFIMALDSLQSFGMRLRERSMPIITKENVNKASI